VERLASRIATTLAVAVLLAAVRPVLAEELALTMADGRVTLTAIAVPLSEVLAAWERVGGTTFANVEDLGAEPVTLELVGVPEAKALGLVLSAASGYLATPARRDAPGVSRFGRVLVMAPRDAAAAHPARPSTSPVASVRPASDAALPPTQRHPTLRPPPGQPRYGRSTQDPVGGAPGLRPPVQEAAAPPSTAPVAAAEPGQIPGSGVATATEFGGSETTSMPGLVADAAQSADDASAPQPDPGPLTAGLGAASLTEVGPGGQPLAAPEAAKARAMFNASASSPGSVVMPDVEGRSTSQLIMEQRAAEGRESGGTPAPPH